MIDRYLLRYFLAVSDQGSFSRAAAFCRVSQPTLSVGIAKLERIIGSPLFIRSSRRVETTAAGVRLIAHARAIEAAFGAAEAVGRDSEARPLVRLGVLSTLPGAWLEDAVGAARRHAPAERLEILEAPQRELLSLLARGRIDAAVAVVPPDVTPRRQLFSEPYALTLPREHRFAEAEAVRAEDLAGEAMIVRRHCEALSDTSRHFTQRGVRPFMAARTISDDRALAHVRAGLGITVMPRCFQGAGVAMPRLAGFEIQRRIGVLIDPNSIARVERTAIFEPFITVYDARGGWAA